MDRLAIYFIAAFLLCLAVTPLFARISLALGIIDHPSRKKFHLTSMPLLGGVAIGLSLVGVLLFINFRGPGLDPKYFYLMAASLLMLFTGLVDDVRSKGVSPKAKLVLQALAGLIFIAGGIRLKAFCPNSVDAALVASWITGKSPFPAYFAGFAIDSVLTIIWVAGISNALNLLDNIDGLSSGTAAISACFFSLFALIIGREDVALICVIFSGCCMGFLFHNFHPASLFLGDAGSMFMGAMLAGFGLMVAQPQDTVSILAIGVVLGMLIFDTGLVTIMRVTHGLSITRGGKDHTSHRLCSLGLGIQGSVATLFSSSFVFGICGIAMLKVERNSALLIPLMLFLISATCWFLLKDTYDYSKDVA